MSATPVTPAAVERLERKEPAEPDGYAIIVEDGHGWYLPDCRLHETRDVAEAELAKRSTRRRETVRLLRVGAPPSTTAQEPQSAAPPGADLRAHLEYVCQEAVRFLDEAYTRTSQAHMAGMESVQSVLTWARSGASPAAYVAGVAKIAEAMKLGGFLEDALELADAEGLSDSIRLPVWPADGPGGAPLTVGALRRLDEALRAFLAQPSDRGAGGAA